MSTKEPWIQAECKFSDVAFVTHYKENLKKKKLLSCRKVGVRGEIHTQSCSNKTYNNYR